MNKEELIKKIVKKKEFSELPIKDVEMALEQFEGKDLLDEEKIKFTRDLLRKVFSAFTSKKILSLKDKEPEWVLKKHLSTRERFPYYGEVYKKLLEGLKGKISVFDFGAGVNGFSYDYFKRNGFDVTYIGVEAIGQLAKLMDSYFVKNNFNAYSSHLSLFEIDKVKELIKKQKSPKVIFLFKTIDSLEMLKRDYSKELLLELVPLVDRVVVSFATRSLVKRKKFFANRKWIKDFIKDKFNILDDFEVGGKITLSLNSFDLFYFYETKIL